MKTMKLTIHLVATLLLTLGLIPLANAQEFPGKKVFSNDEVPDPIGIGKEDQTIYKFDIILDEEDFDNSKDVLDVVPAEFDVIEDIIPLCGAVETYEPRKNKKKNGFFFNLLRPKLNPDFILWDLDCSDHTDGACTVCVTAETLTVSIGTDLNPGHAWHPHKSRTPIYEPTECGPLVINEGAVLIGSDDEEVEYEPSNSLVVATCLVQGDGDVCKDEDEDGWSVDCGDCNDLIAAINPGATDVCDNIDNDCDGTTDEGEPEVCDDGVDNDCDDLTDCADLEDCEDDPDCAQ